MTKELLQQALDEAKADAIYVFTYAEGISAASKDAIEYMHSWLTVYFDKQALAQQEQPAQEQCGCREGECETKKDKACRMTLEIAERDGIPEWTPTIGIDCAISSLRDDAIRLRDGGYTPLQIADDLDVIANDLTQCKPVSQQEQLASVDAYVGAREDAAIWKKRALEAEELNRKFIADVNGPTYLGEPVKQEQPAEEEKLPEFFAELEYNAPYFDVMVSVYRRKADAPPELFYQEKLPEQKPTEQPTQEASATWTEMVVANLVREGVNKHRARELAAHFLTLPTQPALSDDEIWQFWCNRPEVPEGEDDSMEAEFVAACKRAIEAHCRGGANHE